MQSYKTAILLGAARGAAILAAAERGLPVFEYAPRRIKQATVGRGAAEKNQVAFMVRALLGLTETPDPDAADALAIGYPFARAGSERSVSEFADRVPSDMKRWICERSLAGPDEFCRCACLQEELVARKRA